ncbi:phospholipase D-like domain-containing anti-phage protein [Rhodohalobacter mucosus]|uniref:Helicase SNF2 n=1 Tax=Rhodohalobacter mucosus TaxID=2079485 RepID=A0A316TVG8_9BACT|nr:phospholipase D-like domain-containing anti-phage protein [Rhodohalobacter mucosus]PWN06472.1 helicase SNF2 [Rhodohalobacter mucosus]
MIKRYSSRSHKIDESFLNEKLRSAESYDRIAGYFSSSILEVAGEAIEQIPGKVRIICNSDLQQQDVATARAAEMAIRKEWTSKVEMEKLEKANPRLRRLFKLLKSGKMEVRVLPSEEFGLIHGKAGLITQKDGSQLAFMGSTNETYSAWKLNYEMLWEDSSDEAIDWVKKEFNGLWNHPSAVPLSDFVIEDIGRISKRVVIRKEEWEEDGDPAGAVVETPVYRKEYGLWPHQKYFVKVAWDEFQSGRGARFVLADQVGLGKTIQLALTALLIALKTKGPILVIAPKTLIWQWQEEMKHLLNMPSAVWDGRQWVDENGISYPSSGRESVTNCPRRVGILSQGLIVQAGEIPDYLLNQHYECVIVDECHRARRKNLKKDGENEPIQPNNMMDFLLKISPKTNNMLLATATPVQLYPIEAFDLLTILNRGSDHVIGDELSIWKRDKAYTLELIQGKQDVPEDVNEIWDWVRNPLPPANEKAQLFGLIRRRLQKSPTDSVATGPEFNDLNPADKRRLQSNVESIFSEHNPFIRHIIRRERKFLEETIDPKTNEPFLKPVRVRLHGEADHEAVTLPGYLRDAYQSAEEFCDELGERMRAAGFMRTMLLRRMGSSIQAGKNTAIKFLGNQFQDLEAEEEDYVSSINDTETQKVETEEDQSIITSEMTDKEREILIRLISQLDSHKDKDPKYASLKEYLFKKNWLQLGCIVFSQYHDTIRYMADQLSEEFPEIEIAIYAGGNKSGIIKKGEFKPEKKETIKARVQRGELKLLFGTDSASEGLNLQRLGTLINLDLPWNPTRLEQRKGRIQRIGQTRDVVDVYNMRYKDSVEDRVHELLSDRLEGIYDLFGQLPDVLEDVWIEVAIGEKKQAEKIINQVPKEHPFEMRYHQIENIDWETCERVLFEDDKKEQLLKGWS